MIKTKIICTIGPSVQSIEKIIQLIQAGMNVARLNFSHGSHEEHRLLINRLKVARHQLQCPLAIMLDTKGPEIRIGKIATGHVLLEKGQMWHLLKHEHDGDINQITIRPGHILNNLSIGTRILFDDGLISSEVVEITEQGVMVIIDHGGTIRSGKGVNIPNIHLDLPAVTNKDIEDIRFGCQLDVDIIAASFVRSSEHVLAIKRLLLDEHKPNILIMAKIENSEGVHNFENILATADGVIVARGDLGVEVPLSHVPRLQKMMIRRSHLVGKPVITATQMLESMINHPRPTRAETSDVANAVYDGSSAVMLSGETATGKYPLETVAIMHNILEEAEHDFNYHSFFNRHYAELVYQDLSFVITSAVVKAVYTSNAKAIFAFSYNAARLLSRLRPNVPIFAITASEQIFHQMALLWGVIPILDANYTTFVDGFTKMSCFALEHQLLSKGDFVVVAFSKNLSLTNMMSIEIINDMSNGCN